MSAESGSGLPSDPSPPQSNGHLQFVIRATATAARGLSELAAANDLGAVNERDHLQPVFTAALEKTSAKGPVVPTVNADRKLALPDDFDSRGGIDCSLTWPNQLVVLELKAGQDLYACAWDAVKLVAALRAGKCAGAFLVAAAPASRWPPDGWSYEPRQGYAAGAELLATGRHQAETLRDRYASSWRRWDRDGYRPKRAAASFDTSFVTRARFRTQADGASGDWELRVSQVRSVGDVWLTWKTP